MNEKQYLNNILIKNKSLIDLLQDSDFKDPKNILIFQMIKELKSENKEILAGEVLLKIMEKNNIKNGDTWPINLPDAMYLLNILSESKK